MLGRRKIALSAVAISALVVIGSSIMLSLQPSDGWRTYSSQYGYTVQYPIDWSYTVCLNGVRVSFVDWPGAVSTCEGIDGFGPFTIFGPLDSNDVQNGISTSTQRFIKTFMLNGFEVTQFSFDEAPSYPFFSDMVVTKSGETFEIVYPENDAINNSVIDRMLYSFVPQH